MKTSVLLLGSAFLWLALVAPHLLAVEAPELTRIDLGQRTADGALPITVRWTAVNPPPASYEIWFRPAEADNWDWAIQDQANVQQEVADLTPDENGWLFATFNLPVAYVGRNIDIAVRARTRLQDQCSVAGNCSERGANAFELRAAAPENVRATAIAEDVGRLDWDLPGGAVPDEQFASYLFFYRDETGAATILSAGSGGDPGQTSKYYKLPTDRQYTFFVRLVQNQGGGPAPYVNTLTDAATVTLASEPEPPFDGWDARRARDEAGAELPIADAAPGPVTVRPGPGTPLRDAIRAAPAGGTVVVGGGTYREALGTLNKPLTIQAAPGELPVVNGAVRVAKADWSAPDANGVRSIAFPGAELYQATFPYPQNQVDALNPAAGQPEQLFRVDAAGQSLPVEQVLWSHPQFSPTYGNNPPPDRFTYNRFDQKIYARFSDAAWQAATAFEITVEELALRIGKDADGTKLVGLDFRHFAANLRPRGASIPTDGFAAIEIAGESGNPVADVELRDVAVRFSGGPGINIWRASAPVLNRVTSSRNGSVGLNAGRADGARIEFCRFDANNEAGFSIGNCSVNCKQAAVKITYTSGLVARFNSFIANNATGLWIDLDCRDGIIAGNWVVGNLKNGLYWEVSEDAYLVSNVIAQNGGAGIKMSGSRQVKVLHNTLFRNVGSQINIGADFRPATIPFHVDEATHMGDNDVQGNLFVEAGDRARELIVNPVNPTASPNQSGRLAAYTLNGYALVSDNPSQGPIRFLTNSGVDMRTPGQFAANVTWYDEADERVWTNADPRAVFRDASAEDFRIADNVGLLNDWNPGVAIPAAVLLELDNPLATRPGAILGSAAGLAARDADGDKLDDAWEQAFFGDLATTDGLVDSDGDGQMDGVEFYAGTDPRDASSALRLRAASSPDGKRHRLSWNQNPGLFADIQTCPDLNDPNGWTPLVLDVPFGNYTNTIIGGERMFYRLRVQFP